MEGDLSSRKFWRHVRNPLQRRTTTIPTIKDEDGNECHTTQQKLQAQFLNPPQPKNVTVVERKNYDLIEGLPMESLLARADQVKDAAHCILDRPIMLQR